MIRYKEWALPALPIVLSIGILAFVLGRAIADETQVPSLPSSASQQTYDASNPAFDVAPKAPEEEDVARSQVIVVGQVGELLGAEFLPAEGQESQVPSPTEPQHGVRTITQALKVELFVKGGGLQTDTIILQHLEEDAPFFSGRMLLMLTPWRPGTYQASRWSAIKFEDGVVRHANGEEVAEAKGMTLDQYAARLSLIVGKHDRDGAPVELAIPAFAPGEQFDAMHYLGLRNLASVTVTDLGHFFETA